MFPLYACIDRLTYNDDCSDSVIVISAFEAICLTTN